MFEVLKLNFPPHEYATLMYNITYDHLNIFIHGMKFYDCFNKGETLYNFFLEKCDKSTVKAYKESIKKKSSYI